MKSSKTPRPAIPHRGRSSRGTESHGKTSSPSRQKQHKEQVSEQSSMDPPHKAPTPTSQIVHPTVASVMNQDQGSLDAMRQRMSLAMAQKQQQLATASPASAHSQPKVEQEEDQTKSTTQIESSSDESVHTGTLSNDSAKTIKAPFDTTPGTVRTPSYPFPRMQLRLNRGLSNRSAPSHKPFTLLSPTNEPVPEFGPASHADREPVSSETSTPLGQASATGPELPEDPNFPTPDLYDMILMLNAEPGLDMWWANVTEILTEAYAAERASLALPGDITDLENVPWGQKATFNLYGSDHWGGSMLESTTTSELDLRSLGKKFEGTRQPQDAPTASNRRPPLLSRHSIAGVLPEGASRGSRQRPAGPVRAISSIATLHEETPSPSLSPRLTKQSPTPQPQSLPESDPAGTAGEPDSSASASSALRCCVYRSLHPLEAESDALLVRTGVSALFGKRKPVVLTRAYSEGADAHSPGLSRSRAGDEDKSQSSMSGDEARSTSQSASTQSGRPMRAFDEYEQPEPSPWSQSPSPSPAARPDPIESPFFTQPATIDEAAFEQNPPLYDYAATANQSLNAIGADMSKTLIHIPLIQPVPARGAMASSLRFPVAILSLLSPLNPYPRNLRRSLTNLLPHLASSFSLAQQYSALQERLRGGAMGRHGAAFGLGGTFSDEGSELELVAELSGHIAQDKGRSRQLSQQSNATKAGERTTGATESSNVSATNTPMLDQLGFTSGLPTTPARSGSEMIDSYFFAKRQRPGQHVSTPGPRIGTEETSDMPNKSNDKAQSGGKGPVRKTATTASKPPMTLSTPGPGRNVSTGTGSDIGDQSGISSFEKSDPGMRRQPQHRDSQYREDGEKPLPELISSLMLNSVPLQLFLAKPTTGDLVWTNRKFDAFRSQGEGRVRDPWKNVHSEDRNDLVKLWEEALVSGSQFSQYIRVKRFNSDSDFRWFVFRASTLLNNSGRLLYWIGSFLDVHEQYIKNLEASEREATMARDAKIRALADAIPQVMFEALEGEGILSVNQQWHAYSGQTLDDARGLGFAKHVHREDLHRCGIISPSDAAAIAKTMSPGTNSASESGSSTSSGRTAAPLLQKNLFAPDSASLDHMIKEGSVAVEKDENGRLSYLTEIRLRSKGGEYRWFLVRLVRVDSTVMKNGRASWYGTCTDIEIRKALERELNSANKKVHSEMESKTKFFANMSHEIRTPLNGILGSMPWLVDSTLDHDQRRTVDTIQNSANNLRELVDNILDVTKVEAGKMTLLPKWFHVRTLCEEVVDTVSSRAIERGLELNYSLDSNVPSTVKGDPFRVRQVLLNLMGNAVKFTEQGEVYMRCQIREDLKADVSAPPSALLTFAVTDTGRGFNETEFQRLFKQFGQIAGGSNHDAGSGLGLFLSKQLVEMHGGELSVKSQAGEGSTFSFYVKVEIAPAGTEMASPPPTGRSTIQHRHSSSLGGGPRSRSDSKTPTMGVPKSPFPSQGIIQTPGLSRYITSPEAQSPSPPSASPALVSPPVLPSESSVQSGRSNSINTMVASSGETSLVPTPDSLPSRDGVTAVSERQMATEKAMALHPAIRRTKSDNDGSGLAPDVAAHPATYSILVICPAEHARSAIKQHIEQVVPHQIAANVTTIADIGSFLDLMHGPASPTFTHIVLDIPASSDIMLFMRQMANFTAAVIPALVVITDHYQKRDILEDFTMLTSTGRKAYLIHKPIKPSVFAMIFDPAQLRNLSKDRAREVAQTSSDDFRNIAKLVKDTIGTNKAHRVLLVEDSDVNRMVILRYLKKVALENESAKDGQECTDMVLGKPHGFYSLIICDIQMPKKNGYQACTEIRQWEAQNGFPPIPIMALTANAMPEERVAAGAAGFTDYLTKPVDFNTLGMMMITLLDPRIPHTYLRERPLES